MLVDVMLACCWLFCWYFSKVSCHSVCQSELVRSQSGTCRLVEVIFWFFRISVTILMQCIQRRRLLRRIASDILSECVSNSIRWDPMPDGIFGTSVQLWRKAMIMQWCDDDAMMMRWCSPRSKVHREPKLRLTRQSGGVAGKNKSKITRTIRRQHGFEWFKEQHGLRLKWFVCFDPASSSTAAGGVVQLPQNRPKIGRSKTLSLGSGH